MTAHKHAALMLQYAQDAAQTNEPWRLWECKPRGNTKWVQPTFVAWHEDCQYRRKPRTIRIGEFEVPEPWRQPLASGAGYWMVQIIDGEDGVVECSNFTEETGLRHIASGLAHLTREAAEQHARALLSFTKG